MLYGSSKIWLKNLSSHQLQELYTLTQLSRDIYNLSITKISQHYKKTSKVLNFQELKNSIKDSPEYETITGFYYGIMLSCISDFKKFIATNKYVENVSERQLEQKNLVSFNPPKFKKDYYVIVLTKVQLEDGCIVLPKTKLTSEIKIKLPSNYIHKSIVRIIIRPMYAYKSWQLIIQYPVANENHNFSNKKKSLGIDLGLSNFASCATTEGESFIINGKELKSLIQGYCKFKSKLLKSNGGNHNTRRVISLQKKTQNRVDDFVRKSANYILKYSKEHDISQIVLGWGIHFQTVDIGINNQLFALFPFSKFKDLLSFRCEQHGISFKVIDEAYTSKASFLDSDPMPMHITRKKQIFSGLRVSRGLYISRDGTQINADINGALNILRKSSAVVDFNLGSRGIATPKRVNPV